MDESGDSLAREIALRDPRAAFRKRWFACLVDILLAAAALLVVNRFVPESIHAANPYLGGYIAIAIVLAYFWIPEALWGRTVGKWFAKVRVVDASGRPPGWGRALIRTLLRLVEVNPLLLGGIPAGLVAYHSKAGQRIGDILAKTYVLEDGDLARIEGPSKQVAGPVVEA